MRSANSGMHLSHDSCGLPCIYTSQQTELWRSFVQYSSTKEKPTCQPSNCSFLITGGLRWIYSRFDVLFDIMEPRLSIDFLFYHITVSMLITDLNLQWINISLVWMMQHRRQSSQNIGNLIMNPWNVPEFYGLKMLTKLMQALPIRYKLQIPCFPFSLNLVYQ